MDGPEYPWGKGMDSGVFGRVWLLGPEFESFVQQVRSIFWRISGQAGARRGCQRPFDGDDGVVEGTVRNILSCGEGLPAGGDLHLGPISLWNMKEKGVK